MNGKGPLRERCRRALTGLADARPRGGPAGAVRLAWRFGMARLIDESAPGGQRP